MTDATKEYVDNQSLTSAMQAKLSKLLDDYALQKTVNVASAWGTAAQPVTNAQSNTTSSNTLSYTGGSLSSGSLGYHYTPSTTLPLMSTPFGPLVSTGTTTLTWSQQPHWNNGSDPTVTVRLTETSMCPACQTSRKKWKGIAFASRYNCCVADTHNRDHMHCECTCGRKFVLLAADAPELDDNEVD